MSLESRTRVSLPEQTASPHVPVWQPGENVLDLYEVRNRLGEGGMGVVYRVRHRLWDCDLAVKSPRAEILARPGGTESFVFEAENWVKLGLHPHIVSCYYVRVLDGIPRVFAEYVEGGDLHEWVKNRRLYQGAPPEVLRRILDVAIQFAWGLHYAHSRGFTHQDVKPANVLVTHDGVVKVTDFGLSRALLGAPGEVPAPMTSGESTAGRTSPFTPAYASPEQSRNEPLTHKTDLWSWGVSVLEMFMGHPPSWGPLAMFVLDDYVEAQGPLGAAEETDADSGSRPIPAALEELLRACFQENPAARPADFGVVTERLMAIYQQECGEPYSRSLPDAASLEADGLNNRAVSLMDLGLAPEAMALLDAAVAADGRHPQVRYNRALVQWRTGHLTDEGALAAMRDLETAQGEQWESKLNTAALHLERGDDGGARRLYSEAVRLAPAHDDTAEAALDALEKRIVPGLGYRVRLEGHSEAVLAVALSHTGEVVVTGSQDRTVRAWQPNESDKALRLLRGHQAPIYAVAVSPDGRFAFSASEDGGLMVWDLASGGRIQARMHGHQGAIWCLALAQNGQVTCSGGQDGTVRMWESASGREVRLLQHDSPVTTVAVNGNGRMVVAGLASGQCVVWDTSTNQAVRTMAGHTGPVRGLGLVAAGRAALSAGSDGTLRLWNLERGEAVHVLGGHRGAIESLAVEPEGVWAVTGGEDRTVRIWDLTAPRCWRTIETNSGRVYGVSLAASEHRLASANADRVADLWDFYPGTPWANPAVVRPRRSEELVEVQTGYQQVLQQAYQSLREGEVPRALQALHVARSMEGFERSAECLELWAWLSPYARRGKLLGSWLLSSLAAHRGRVTGVVCSPSGRQAVTVGEDGFLRVWDLADMVQTGSWQVDSGPLHGLAVDRHGRRALVQAHQGLLVWDVVEGRAQRSLVGHKGQVVGVAIDSEGERGVSTAKDGTSRVWDLDCGDMLWSVEGQGEAVALRSDGGRLAWGSPGGTSRVFDVGTKQVLSTVRGHEGAVRAVLLSLDGSLLLSGGEDKTVRSWDVASGKPVKVMKGHSRGVAGLASSLDGRLAVSAGKDKSLIIWDVPQGQALGTLVGHAEMVSAVAMTADARLVLSGSLDGSVRLWYLDWELVPWERVDWASELAPWLQDFRARRMGWRASDRLTRQPPASWNEQDFEALFVELGYAGLGGVSAESVHAALTQ